VENIYLTIVLAPLVGAILAGLFGKQLGRVGAHSVTILGVGLSFLLSLVVFKYIVIDGNEAFNGPVYTWMVSEGINMQVGFLVDKLTTLMLVVVTFVSLMVHIYTIGYMADDEHNWPKTSLAGRHSYQRFFAYIALFTFSMLMLVMSNNFLQLFFGWEAVGLVSYLLIGFWSTRPTAIFANMKAFLVNRVGDRYCVAVQLGGLRHGICRGAGAGGCHHRDFRGAHLDGDERHLHSAVYRRHG
jgi:NADH-quinone oxidoreductase subunit L